MTEPAKIATRWQGAYSVWKRPDMQGHEVVTSTAVKLVEELSAAEEEIAGVIEFIVPTECQIRVREGGGEENLIASLSVSVAALVRRLAEAQRAEQWKEETLEQLQNICEENGCPWGWDRLDFLRDYLRLQKKKLTEAESKLSFVEECFEELGVTSIAELVYQYDKRIERLQNKPDED